MATKEETTLPSGTRKRTARQANDATSVALLDEQLARELHRRESGLRPTSGGTGALCHASTHHLAGGTAGRAGAAFAALPPGGLTGDVSAAMASSFLQVARQRGGGEFRACSLMILHYCNIFFAYNVHGCADVPLAREIFLDHNLFKL